MKRRIAWALAAALAACHAPDSVELRIDLPRSLTGRGQKLRVLPEIAESFRWRNDDHVRLRLKQNAGKIRIELPGACPQSVDTRDLPKSALSLRPLFDVGPDERIVGLGQRFELRATAQCAEAERVRTRFVVSGGAQLGEVHDSSDGRRLSALASATLPSSMTEGRPGIVAVSAKAAALLRSEITLLQRLEDGEQLERKLGVSAVARASGLPNVGLSHPVLFRAPALQLLEKPPGSVAELLRLPQLWQLRPDVPGRYRLSDGRGLELSLRSGRYDETPLDCGRSDCHSAIAKSAQDSPMTHVLASDLGGCHSLSDPTCASACHATGEPGTADGGFTQVMAELGLARLPADYDDLPLALRRVGGVGCMACHGPSKIPDPEARSWLARSEVCAVCHDAPPRYGHVAALTASRMSHSDGTPETRREPCARCHTSWGALNRPAPADHAEAGGISCQTCHDVHPHGAASKPGDEHVSLLRQFTLPETLSAAPASFSGPSRVCIGCHAPSRGDARPEASAALLVAGQGGADPETGAEMRLESAHARDARGCLGCHDSGPEGLVLGQSHAFRSTEQGCHRCHATPPARDPSIAARARELLARFDGAHSVGDVARPWHGRYDGLPTNVRQRRIVQNLLLVLEDPAADVHHPAYARALLDSATTSSEPRP